MPNGCNHDGEGEFGDCCGSDGKCGSWAFGPNAEDVEWPDMPITEWNAGSSQGPYTNDICTEGWEGVDKKQTIQGWKVARIVQAS